MSEPDTASTFAPGETPYLDVRGVTFGYEKRAVLEDVSFRVVPGEMVALVGPNGSGKSTLIRLVTAILKPSHGSITLGGDESQQLSPREMARRVGVVGQETPIGFDFTAFEVALMGRSARIGPMGRESPRDLEIVREAMARTDCLHLADRSIGAVSGGERQRVIVARALAQEPKILLLDEPTAHLDINHQLELLLLVSRLTRDRSMATLAVLHDLNLASLFADRVVMLNEGRVAADGAPGEVLTVDRIQQVFQAPTIVVSHPHAGRPVILLDPAARG